MRKEKQIGDTIEPIRFNDPKKMEDVVALLNPYKIYKAEEAPKSI